MDRYLAVLKIVSFIGFALLLWLWVEQDITPRSECTSEQIYVDGSCWERL